MIKQFTRVKLAPNSKWYLQGDRANPKDEVGVVISMYQFKGSPYFIVEWASGKRNDYKEKDLIVVNKIKE